MNVVDEYILYVWHRQKEQYVQIGASLTFSYDACKKFAEDYSFLLGENKYSEFDFTDYHIKMRRITYTDWEVINDG